jgi:predicted dehydrogenase
MNKIRLAFLGFRHGHIMGMYESARKHPRVEVVAACEEHDATAAALRAGGQVQLTHSSYDDIYSNVDFDAVAVGDYFARRGEIIISDLYRFVRSRPDRKTRVTEAARRRLPARSA